MPVLFSPSSFLFPFPFYFLYFFILFTKNKIFQQLHSSPWFFYFISTEHIKKKNPCFLKTKKRPYPLTFTVQIVSRTSEWTSWCFQTRCACLCIYIPSVTNAQINTDKCVMEICVSRNQITGNCLWNLAICLRFSSNWQHIYTKLLCSRFFNGSFIQNSLKLYVKATVTNYSLSSPSFAPVSVTMTNNRRSQSNILGWGKAKE